MKMSGNIPFQWIYNSHMGAGGCSIAISVQWTIPNTIHESIKTYIVMIIYNMSDHFKHDSPKVHEALNNMIPSVGSTALSEAIYPWQQEQSFQTNCWWLRHWNSQSIQWWNWGIHIPMKWGAVWSYLELPNHRLVRGCPFWRGSPLRFSGLVSDTGNI